MGLDVREDMGVLQLESPPSSLSCGIGWGKGEEDRRERERLGDEILNTLRAGFSLSLIPFDFLLCFSKRKLLLGLSAGDEEEGTSSFRSRWRLVVGEKGVELESAGVAVAVAMLRAAVEAVGLVTQNLWLGCMFLLAFCCGSLTGNM